MSQVHYISRIGKHSYGLEFYLFLVSHRHYISLKLHNSLIGDAITMQKVVELALGVIFLSDLQMLTSISLQCKTANE